MRVDAYKPEFPADNTAVKIMAFIKLAAKVNPNRSNTSVKGLIEMFSTLLFNRLESV